MTKIMCFILVTFFLTGCGVFEKASASLTGYSSLCIDGVLYYQFTSGATVAFNKDGSVKQC